VTAAHIHRGEKGINGPVTINLDINAECVNPAPAEIKARVANFRAHQERFSQEREAYCSATMAKVRAALGEHSEPSRLGK